MSFFPTKPQFVGIELTSSSIKIVSLRKNRNGWEILNLKEVSLEKPVNPLYNISKEGTVISSISSREVLVRNVEMQIKRKKDIFSALEFQVEPLLPYSCDKAIIQAQIIAETNKKTLLTAFSVRVDHLENHLKQLGDFHIEPEKVTCIPYALAAFSTLSPLSHSPLLVVHVGCDEVSCALVEKGKLLASHAFDRSLDLTNELQKTILSFSTSHKTKQFEAILLLGQDPSLSETIQKASSKPVFFPLCPSLPLSQEELIRFGLSIGIALSSSGPNFRQKTFTYPHPWKKLKKPLLAYSTLTSIFFVIFFSFLQVSLNHKKREIKNTFQALLKMENKSDPLSQTLVTAGEYSLFLKNLEKEIQSRPETFPLLPKIPQVKEVLAWLSTHPNVVAKNTTLLTFDTFRYSMVKRPSFTNRNERYKVKVELEFSTLSSQVASAFHEALLSPNPFIDPKEEVEWLIGKGKYKASFYLNDKTRYHTHG